MNVMLLQPWTQDSFLQWVACQEEPYEFDGIGPVPMNGGTYRHSLIGQNITHALRNLLDGRDLFVVGAGAGVETVASAVRYPDAFVTTAEPAATALLITDVIVAFEVISPSSERTDRLLKLHEYAAVPSLRRYIIVEQSFAGLTVHSRTEANAPWVTGAIADLGGSVALPEIGTALYLRDIYAGVRFTDVAP